MAKLCFFLKFLPSLAVPLLVGSFEPQVAVSPELVHVLGDSDSFFSFVDWGDFDDTWLSVLELLMSGSGVRKNPLSANLGLAFLLGQQHQFFDVALQSLNVPFQGVR